MIKTTTLNQVIDIFRQFSIDHPMLNDFGYGQTSDIGVTKQMEFPYMFVTHQLDSTIKIENKTQTPELKLIIMFMDKLSDQPQTNDENGFNSNNGQEILSDTLQILQDFIKTINTQYNQSGIQLVEDVRCYPGIDATTDVVHGFIGELTLRLTYANGNCIIPS